MSTDKSIHRQIMKSSAVVSCGILSSRLLGFIRDIIFAGLLGTGFKGEAFFVAWRIPNMFRDLIGEGAANSAVIPVLSEHKQKEAKEDFWRLVNVVLVLFFIGLSAVTVLGIAFSGQIVKMLAPGFIADPGKLSLAADLTVVLFPYLILIGLAAYLGAVLISFRSFSAASFSPCLLNISIIVSAVAARFIKTEPVYVLSLGILIGGILQLLALLPDLYKKGFRLQIPLSLAHSGAKKIGRLLAPRLIGTSVYQLNVFVDTLCASLFFWVGPGGVSALYYSNRIVQLPLGVFSTSLAAAILPTLSDLHIKDDKKSFQNALIFSVENMIFLMLPITLIIMFTAYPLIRVLFERGEFNRYSTYITGSALSFYVIGLFAFSANRLIASAFHSMQDTKTPVKIAAWSLALNTVLVFIFMWPFKIAGISLASAISSIFNFHMLLREFDRRHGETGTAIRKFLFKNLIAVLVCGSVVFLLLKAVTIKNDIWYIIFCGTSVLILYFIISLSLKIEQANTIKRFLKLP
ncbi:MAG: murein biosynthesis integral membrane protein MurJ [Candidatus Omnitrophica bacterium]|nr:murein biosynthesis integral membrane protein MurJ [Candidatus Omnitrophota bacterium]